MTTNDHQGPEMYFSCAEKPRLPAQPPVRQEKRVYTTAEKLLLPVALAIAVLYDRLCFSPVTGGYFERLFPFTGAFWICYLVLLYCFYWKRLARNRVLWFVAGCAAALCVWSFFYTRRGGNEGFGVLSYIVVPAVLMAHAQFLAGGYNLKEVGGMALAWIQGWIIKPFSALPMLAGAVSATFAGDNRSTAKKVLTGVAVTLPLLLIIIPLLSGADRMFGYYLEMIIGGWNLGLLIAHLIVIAVAFALFYSFLWNIGFAPKQKSAGALTARLDTVICCIVLGSVTVVYLLFCAVQFTYLFAGAGLPEGITYSEYAREGFAQTVAVCAVNLCVFGGILGFGNGHRVVTGLLAGLLGLTGVMLFSGFVRLKLYIDAYGLTWLRILSAWFVVYLAAVVILCAVRLLRPALPAVALCALILLGWFTALGYANPNALAERYNSAHNYDVAVRELHDL